MSLWFPVMVNSHQIGEVTITRQEQLKSTRALHEYTWEAWWCALDAQGLPTNTGLTKSASNVRHAGGTVRHRYDKGWAALAAKVLVQFSTGYLGEPT